MSEQVPPYGAAPEPGPAPEPMPEWPPASIQTALPAPPPAPPFVPPVAPFVPPVVVTKRRGPGIIGTVLIAAVVAAIVGAFAGLGGYVVGRSVDSAAAATSTAVKAAVVLPQAGTGVSAPASGSIAEIAKATLPSVVSILAEGTAESGSGSGFVVRSDGYLLTNNHVVSLIADGGTLTVIFSDGKRSPGKVIGTSLSYDLAVVKVDRLNLPAVTLGNSAAVSVGDTAIAIGAPLGLDGTVTSGIISALDRPVTAGGSGDLSYINAIQTDAAINPGNSGGPLLNGAGQVIGVNSAIATLAVAGETGNIGLGFAIPINSAKRVAEELISTGTSKTPLMGVQLDMAYTDAGARVQTVTPRSPASDAGLQPGDVIVRIDERGIDDATELVVEVRNHAPGDTIRVSFQRSGKDQTVSLVLGDDSANG
jgi:putative serine protease PepD